MIEGPFQRLRHVHEFQAVPAGTIMVDVFDFASPLGVLGNIADLLVVHSYLRRFLEQRNAVLKRAAEAQG